MTLQISQLSYLSTCTGATSHDRSVAMNVDTTHTVFSLSRHRRTQLRPGTKPSPPGADMRTDPDDSPSTMREDAVACRQCLHEISSPAQQQVIDGAHTHTFANPEGILFEIACYQDAWGCVYVGASTFEFTWFTGYAWRIAVCANCHIHLGWVFSSLQGHVFHGLITSRIVNTTT